LRYIATFDSREIHGDIGSANERWFRDGTPSGLLSNNGWHWLWGVCLRLSATGKYCLIVSCSYSALLLGRLSLPIRAVIDELTAVALGPFSMNGSAKGARRNSNDPRMLRLRATIEAMLERYHLPPDLILENDIQECVSCMAFLVPCLLFQPFIYRTVWDGITTFRTWGLSSERHGHLFVDAACSTLAVLPSSDQKIGGNFILPSLHYDSPLPMIIREAMRLVARYETVSLTLSLGKVRSSLRRLC
jgi:hypothetical protein